MSHITSKVIHSFTKVISMNRIIARNAISKEFLQQLNHEMHNYGNARAIILKSDVPKVFCAGADLKERSTMSLEEATEFVEQLRGSFHNIYKIEIPTIAVIEGPALGGGLELALACDLRVCTPSAILGLPETSLAIIPGAGGTQSLSRIIGISKAKEFIYLAKKIDGQEAQQIGLVNKCAENAFEVASNWALAIESNVSTQLQGPIAIKAAKCAIQEGIQYDLKKGLEIEFENYAKIIPTQDRIEALQAFKEKRKPVFKGE